VLISLELTFAGQLKSVFMLRFEEIDSFRKASH